jgi:hypothetical protein
MKALDWIMDKCGGSPQMIAYSMIGAVVLGLAGHSGYQIWVKEKELRREFAQEEVHESSSLETSLSTPIKKYDWKPIDITERIKEGMDYFGDSVVFEPEINKRIGGILEDHASQNGNWWASMSVRRTDGGRYLSSAFLQSEFPFEYRVNTWMLFDKKNEKIYALTWEDEKIAGLPEKDFSVSSAMVPPTMPQVADNGACAYSVNSSNVFQPESRGDMHQARIIADISGRRKYVIPITSIKMQFYPAVELSRDGSCARITESSYDKRYAELDIRKGTLEEKKE